MDRDVSNEVRGRSTMNRALPLLLLLLSCAPEELPYPWFEGLWISDRDSTLEANPAFHDLDAAELEALLSQYGDLSWRVEGFTLEARYRDDPRFDLRAGFTLEAIDDSSFRLLTETGIAFAVSGNEDGFCVTPPVAAESIECFVPSDP